LLPIVLATGQNRLDFLKVTNFKFACPSNVGIDHISKDNDKQGYGSLSIRDMLLVLALISPLSFAEAAERTSEYNVKAAYLYQIPKFINWPLEYLEEGDPLHLCILGDDPFRGALQKIHLRQVQGRELHVQYIKKVKNAFKCHILYLSSDFAEQKVLDQYHRISDQHILTIGESGRFARDGGIIALTLRNDRVALEVNLKAAEDAQIKVSSNLLEIASRVYNQKGQ